MIRVLLTLLLTSCGTTGVIKNGDHYDSDPTCDMYRPYDFPERIICLDSGNIVTQLKNSYWLDSKKTYTVEITLSDIWIYHDYTPVLILEKLGD